MNRIQCLRLTERCTDILLSVRPEVREAGDQIPEELRQPVEKLVECVVLLHFVSTIFIWFNFG